MQHLGRRIDLIKHVAWLFHARREIYEPGWTEGNYEAHKDAVNARSRAESESSRDIAAVDSGLWNRYVATGATQSGKTLTCFVIFSG